MLGTVFHYAVVEPEDDHARCEAQAAGVIAMHERMGYRQGGAYNGHFCQHGGIWISYTGPNQATGHQWANLNLHAWCYLATVGTPVTPQAQQAAYDLTLFEPSGRDQIYPHSAFFATSCCGDLLRDWIAAGALAPAAATTPPPQEDEMRLIRVQETEEWVLVTPLGYERNITPDRVWAYAAAGIPTGTMPNAYVDAFLGSVMALSDDVVRRVASKVPAGGGGATEAQIRAVVADVLDGSTIRV